MNMKKWFCFSFTAMLCLILTGCWNYREIEDLLIVGGVAIDKGDNDQYLLTVETIQMEGGTDAQIVSKSFSINGKTMFDANRNHISLTGKRLYWSHAKTVVISEELAKEGVLKFLDWFHRDSETRDDIKIMIAKKKSAKEILLAKKAENNIKGLELAEMLTNQNALSKAPDIEIWKVINEIATPGISAILPVVHFNKDLPKSTGTAIFNQDRLAGFLDSQQTQTLLFARDEIKGGILVVEENTFHPPISMEIFNSTTKMEPIIEKDAIKIQINIETRLGLSEIVGNEMDMDEQSLLALKKEVDELLSKRVEDLISFIQSKYGTDIFGFGAKIHAVSPKTWKRVENNWEDYYKELNVQVTSNVNIINSGMVAEPLKMGD